jgi:hypothetical protein
MLCPVLGAWTGHASPGNHATNFYAIRSKTKIYHGALVSGGAYERFQPELMFSDDLLETPFWQSNSGDRATGCQATMRQAAMPSRAYPGQRGRGTQRARTSLRRRLRGTTNYNLFKDIPSLKSSRKS